MQYWTKNIRLQFTIDLIKTENCVWYRLLECKICFRFSTTKLFGFHMHYICSWSRGLCFTVVRTIWEASFSDSEKKLSFALDVCFYLIGSFQNCLEQILTHSFLRYCWFEDFPYLHIRDAGRCPSKAEHLYSTAATEGSFGSRVLAHCSCCWGPFGKKKTTYT